MQKSRINVNAPQGSKLITYSFKNQFTALFKKQWTYQVCYLALLFANNYYKLRNLNKYFT